MANRDNLVHLLALLLAVGAIAVGVVALLYRWRFDGAISVDHAVWGQFGDFIGGTLNPVFAYLSFTALILALAVQTRQLNVSVQQLALSREELNAAREEVRRSADAQAATAVALSRQAEMAALSARIAALSSAMNATESALSKYRAVDPTHSAYGARNELAQKLDSLRIEFDVTLSRVLSAA